MCLATPSKVIKIEKDWATVQSHLPGGQADNHQHKANLSLVKNVKIGDYLLIHDNLAINKVPKSEAKKILKIVNGLSK